MTARPIAGIDALALSVPRRWHVCTGVGPWWRSRVFGLEIFAECDERRFADARHAAGVLAEGLAVAKITPRGSGDGDGGGR